MKVVGLEIDNPIQDDVLSLLPAEPPCFIGHSNDE